MIFCCIYAIIDNSNLNLKFAAIARYKKRTTPKIPFYRRNYYIRISPIRLIDDEGENLGVIETEKAQKMAQEKGLDLIEVSPNTRPPVCKIMSWSKFKYNLSKKRKGSSKGKSKDMKEMRFSPYIGEGDINHKKRKVEEFLEERHPVKIIIFVRGRVNRDVIYGQMENISNLFRDKWEIEEKPRREGRNLSRIIFPKKKVVKTAANKEPEKGDEEKK